LKISTGQEEEEEEEEREEGTEGEIVRSKLLAHTPKLTKQPSL
jgi:hypothetical protein